MDDLITRARQCTDKGGLIFLVGEPGSGRSATLNAFVEEASKLKPKRALAGVTFVESGNATTFQDVRRQRRLLQRGIQAAGSILGLMHPAAGLATQLAQEIATAHDLTQERERAGLTKSPDDLLLVLRRTCRARPTVCVLDDFSNANIDWWQQFLRAAMPEVLQLRLLIVAAIEKAPPNGEGSQAVSHEQLAISLGSPPEVTLVPVTAISEEDFSTWVGGAHQSLARDLVRITGGSASWLEDLWVELTETDHVRQSRDGRWRWAHSSRDPFGIVRQIVDFRVERLVRDQNDRDIAKSLLRLGALEGATFTVEAQVRAMSVLEPGLEADHERVVDLLDDRLAATDDRSSGIVVETDAARWPLPQGLERVAWRYDFLSDAHVAALARFGLTGDQTTEWSGILADALRVVYEHNEDAIAGTLARLYREVNPALSREYEWRANRPAAREALMARVELDLASDPTTWQRVDLLLAAERCLTLGGQLLRRQPLTETLSLAERAYDYANSAESALHLSEAARLRAHILNLAGQHEAALGLLEQERKRLQAAGKDEHVVLVTHEIVVTKLDVYRRTRQASGENAHALLEIETLAEDVVAGAPKGSKVHDCLLNDLGFVHYYRGELDQAIHNFGLVRKSAAHRGDVETLQTQLRTLGSAYVDLKDYERAKAYLGQGLELSLRLGDKLSAANAHSELGYIALQCEELPQARDHLLSALDVVASIGASASIVSVLGNLVGYARRSGYADAEVRLIALRMVAEESDRHPGYLEILARSDPNSMPSGVEQAARAVAAGEISDYVRSLLR